MYSDTNDSILHGRGGMIDQLKQAQDRQQVIQSPQVHIKLDMHDGSLSKFCTSCGWAFSDGGQRFCG